MLAFLATESESDDSSLSSSYGLQTAHNQHAGSEHISKPETETFITAWNQLERSDFGKTKEPRIAACES